MMSSEQRLIDVRDCPCDGCQAKPCGHPARCIKFSGWLNKTVDSVAVPCKIGDEVWGIRRSNKGALAPHRGIVSHMYFAEDMKLCIVVQHICRGEWGKKVFATYEDAFAAIRERREGDG